MIVIDFYFDNNGGWIEYSQNGNISKVEFSNGDDIKQFIIINHLNITYKGCLNL